MSTKRSWDIQPKKKAAPAAKRPALQSAPARRQPERRVAAPSRPQILHKPAVRQPAPRAASPRVPLHSIPKAQERPKAIPSTRPKVREKESLKERRRRERRRAIVITVLAVLVLVVGVTSSFWLKPLRIQTINVAGPDSQGVQAIASAALAGSYQYIIPKNSIFFFPEDEIQNDILKQYPDISEVAISRTSPSSIAITSVPREVAMVWCGATYTPSTQTSLIASTSSQAKATTTVTISTKTKSTSTAKLSSKIASTTALSIPTPVLPPAPSSPTCYSADAQGIIFATTTEADASAAGTLLIYAPLASSTNANEIISASGTSPIGETIAQASVLPNVFEFIKAIKSLGVPIASLVLRGDEADLYAESGTRITYVLGQEQAALLVAESVFPSLSLNDGSLEYIDLRFPGKAYYKAIGSSSAQTSNSK